jgi:hypothetical protein
MELVLRFILLFDRTEDDLQQLGGDVGEFLTTRMREMALKPDLDYSHIEQAFEVTFNLLDKAMGDNSFKRYRGQYNKFFGGFLLSAYEVVALGIGYHYKNPLPTDQISERIKTIWSDATYQKWSGAGVNAARRLPHLVPLGRKAFSQ